MIMRMPVTGVLFGVVVVTCGWPVHAADPSTVFSVAVLKSVKKVFEDRLEKTNSVAYVAGKCDKTRFDPDDIDINFPLPKDSNMYGFKYKRIFYECQNPTLDLFKAFGDASLEAAKAAGSNPDVNEPVRVTQDTSLKPPPGSGCSLSLCQNGTYRKTTNWLICTQC